MLVVLLQDERFNPKIDGKTGYKTRSMLCMPIKDSAGEVIGVAQVCIPLHLTGPANVRFKSTGI